MQTRIAINGVAAAMCALTAGLAWAGTEGTDVTFYGVNAGHSISSLSSDETFIGYGAGYSTTTGAANTFIGVGAGASNNIGSYNTFLGMQAGSSTVGGSNNVFVGFETAYSGTSGSNNTAIGNFAGNSNQTGSASVFVGYNAGRSETVGNRLYIDNCYSGGSCTVPLIYGEFDNHLLKLNGVTHVAANSVAKSQMHFSLDNGDYGGFLTSVLPNNFFVSSGARYDSGNWVQRSADGNAVMAGSGGAGYRIFTHTGGTVGNTFNDLTLRLQIDYSGQFGINTAPVAGHEIHTGSGAYVAGGAWVDGSSRELKDNIHRLSTEDAVQALAALDPVTFNYKSDRAWQHVGFIAEEVPQLVAAPDRKGLAPMDIVAVLTKVVQEQKEQLARQERKLQQLANEVEQMKIGGK